MNSANTKWLNNNKATEISEIDLFIRGIKPAIYVPYDKEAMNILNKVPNIHTKIIQSIWSEYILISRGPIPESILISDRIGQIHEQMGLILGYYPKSCKHFGKRDDTGKLIYNTFLCLNFSGIPFNTHGLAEEALEWCKKEYGGKILDQFGYYYYIIDYLGVTVEKGIACRNAYIIENLR